MRRRIPQPFASDELVGLLHSQLGVLRCLLPTAPCFSILQNLINGASHKSKLGLPLAGFHVKTFHFQDESLDFYGDIPPFGDFLCQPRAPTVWLCS